MQKKKKDKKLWLWGFKNKVAGICPGKQHRKIVSLLEFWQSGWELINIAYLNCQKKKKPLA